MRIKSRLIKLEEKRKAISKMDIISYDVTTINNIDEAIKNPYIFEKVKDEIKVKN